MDSNAAPVQAVRRIGVVEDHSIMIAGLRSLLVLERTVEITAAAASVDDLLARTTKLDLVVLDLRLPDGSSPTANVGRLRAAGINILVLTSGDEPFLVREAARAGVLGVLCKAEPDDVVVAAIRTAAEGTAVPTTDWAAAIDGDTEFVEVSLSTRERQVLALYASGEPAARVARLTGLSVETVNVYLGRIRVKYERAGRPAPTKTDLLKRAIEDGWLPIPRHRRTR
jgi:DNA-binding NarL/FixJ family response regulator